MKFTEAEYRNFIKKEQNLVFKILYAIKILKFEIVNRRVWNNNNDYSYNIKMVRFNPLSYVVLTVLVLFSFFVGGFNKEHFNDVKKELKRLW